MGCFWSLKTHLGYFWSPKNNVFLYLGYFGTIHLFVFAQNLSPKTRQSVTEDPLFQVGLFLPLSLNRSQGPDWPSGGAFWTFLPVNVGLFWSPKTHLCYFEAHRVIFFYILAILASICHRRLPVFPFVRKTPSQHINMVKIWTFWRISYHLKTFLLLTKRSLQREIRR